MADEGWSSWKFLSRAREGREGKVLRVLLSGRWLHEFSLEDILLTVLLSGLRGHPSLARDVRFHPSFGREQVCFPFPFSFFFYLTRARLWGWRRWGRRNSRNPSGSPIKTNIIINRFLAAGWKVNYYFSFSGSFSNYYLNSKKRWPWEEKMKDEISELRQGWKHTSS